MRVVVLVPRRADNGRRDEVWAYVLSRWLSEHPDWTIYTGHHEHGPFNRSAAINDAAAGAGDWDVAIIADSDSFVGPEQINAAVEGCWSNGQMWLAYDKFMYLSRSMSDQIMDGFDGMWENGVEWDMTNTCSSMVVVRRDVWDQARGYDEGFESWGYEDVAFSHACQTFGGGLSRVPGCVWHLWHPPSIEGRHTSWDDKTARAERYHRAAYDKEAMRALIDELHSDVHV